MELMKYGYNLGIYRQTGLCIAIEHALHTHCHALVTGSSGSGTYHNVSHRYAFEMFAGNQVVVL